MTIFLKYFVLKPKGTDIYARASRIAMNKYAEIIEEDDPELAKHLYEWTTKMVFKSFPEGKYNDR